MTVNAKRFGVGVDIVDIDRFRCLDRIRHRTFLRKAFTDRELTYCFAKRDPAQHLAACYAGKEAVVKALRSLSSRTMPYRAVAIRHARDGAPLVRLGAPLRSVRVSMSLSHDAGKAVAFAIVYRTR